MNPATSIPIGSEDERTVVDVLGRHLVLRDLTALDKLRLLKAAGPELALNQPWLAVAVLAASVAAIDDVPCPRPSTEAQIEALVGRLGDAGIESVANALSQLVQPDEAVQAANAGNLLGTPS